MIFHRFLAVCATFFQVHYHFSSSFASNLSRCLEIAGEKLYISQLPGLQNKKNSLTSTGHAGNLPYANKTNKLRKIDYIIVKANIIRGSFTQQRRLPESKSQLIVQFA